MILLSIDVGIRNLAFVIINIDEHDIDKHEIVKCEVVELIKTEEKVVSAENKMENIVIKSKSY